MGGGVLPSREATMSGSGSGLHALGLHSVGFLRFQGLLRVCDNLRALNPKPIWDLVVSRSGAGAAQGMQK